MKKTPLFTFTLLILFTLCSQNIFAQDSPQWGLPEGAKARLGKGSIYDIQYSPDGTRLAVAGGIGIWLYDTATHQEMALLMGHTITVFSVAFSPDGKTLASGSYDNTVRLWDAKTGQHKATLTGHTNWIRSVAFNPDGDTLASGSHDGTVRLWDAKTGQHKATLTGHTNWVRSVAFNPDGDTLASGSHDGTVRLWDAKTGQHRATLTGGAFESVTFSPDGQTIASGSWDNTVRLWDAKTGQHNATLTGHTGGVFSVPFSPDGQTIASGSWDNTVRMWNAKTGQHNATLTGHRGAVYSVAYSPDGQTIASGGRGGTVRLWNAKTGQHKTTLMGHTYLVLSVAYSPDGQTIASGSYGEIRLWDAKTGQQKDTLTGHKDILAENTSWVGSVAYSPDGKTIVSGTWDTTVRLWDANTGQQKATLTGHTGEVHSVAYSPDGKTIASGSYDGTVLLWNAKTGQPKATLTGHTGYVYSVAYSPDGKTIVSGSHDNTVRLWDAKTGQPKATLTGHTGYVYSVAYSPDGKTIVSGSDGGTVRLWNAKTGQPKATLTGHTSSVFSVAFSPDGKTIASGGGYRDNTVRLWDAKTGQHKTTLTGHRDRVYSVAYSPDGKTIASGSWDGTVLLWEFTPSATVEPPVSMPADTSSPQDYTQRGLQSDEFDGSDQNLQPFWHVQNGDKSSWELKDGQLVIDGGFNQNLWSIDTSTGFYQITDQEQFTVETSLIFDHRDVGSFVCLVISSPTTQDRRGRDEEWVLLKLWGHGAADENGNIQARYENTPVSGPGLPQTAILQFQHREREIVPIQPNYNPPQGNIPIAMRLKRDGDDYEAWFKPDAEGEWISVGKTTIALQEPLQVGLYGGINQLEAPGHLTVSFDYFRTTTAGYLLSVPAGINLIHVPLKVTTVDGVAKTITSIADLYDALGGASTVNFLITYDTQAKEWRGYFGTPDTGTPADRVLTDDMGVIAALTTRVSVHLGGNPLGTNGKSSITLNQGINVVGLPLRDTRINRVSDLFKLDGIRGNTPGIILTDGREFKLVGRPGDSGDIEITGGQAFILTAIQAATVAISGEPWTNPSGTAAAPPLALTGIQVTDITPVLGMRGAVVDDRTGLNNPGFRVTVKNISTGRTAAVVTGPDEVDYRLTIVDIETGQVATVGDILEISAHSTNPSIGVQPLRYTVTAEDVKRSLILLEALVAYEIPTETELLRNYPNPFNPETWIPYRLAEDAVVTLTIYDQMGRVVRTLDVGHRVAAVYESRSKAIYWDGRNQVGEQVASGVYFYHLSAGDYSDTRKMIILK